MVVPTGRACGKLFSALLAIQAGKFIRRGFGQYLHLGNRGNAGQRLSAKAEGADAVKILFLQNFAGGMTHKGCGDILALNAAAVVLHRNLRNTAAPDLNRNASCTCVYCVFHQFLDHRGGAFYHLAGGNQLCCVLI